MSASVRGYCPACGQETLVLAPRGYITCTWAECPDPVAPAEVLERRPEPVMPPLPTEPGAVVQAWFGEQSLVIARSETGWYSVASRSPLVLGSEDHITRWVRMVPEKPEAIAYVRLEGRDPSGAWRSIQERTT